MHSLQWSSAFSRNHTGCLLKPGLPLSVCVTLSALRHHSLACVRTCCMQVSSLSARHITFSFMFHRSETSVRSSFPLCSPSFPPRPSFLSRSSILTRTSTSLYPSPSLFPGRTWVSVVCSVVTSLQDFLHCATLPCSFLRHLKLLCSRSPPEPLASLCSVNRFLDRMLCLLPFSKLCLPLGPFSLLSSHHVNGMLMLMQTC